MWEKRELERLGLMFTVTAQACIHARASCSACVLLAEEEEFAVSVPLGEERTVLFVYAAIRARVTGRAK